MSLLKIKKLSSDATIPTRGTPGSAGLDLYSNENTDILPKTRMLIKTGIAMRIPSGCFGRILSRSSLASRHMIDVQAGLCDEDYRGEILVLLHNSSQTMFSVRKGDRIAQMVIQRYETPDIEVVEELDITSRSGGFGSTGR